MSTEPAEKTAQPDTDPSFGIDRRTQTVMGEFRGYLKRLRSGDLGALPAVLGLIALCILFSALRPNTFPSAINFANLVVQAAPITLLAMGLVFVLLLGEIDLSAGVVGGVSAAIMAQLLASTGQSWYVAVLAGLATALVLGTFIGWLVAVIGIPSFVVTLALFLGLQGVTLRIIGQGGTIPINNQVINAIAGATLPVAVGWVLSIAVVATYAAITLIGWQRRRARGLSHKPFPLVIARVVGIGALLLLGTLVLSVDRARSPALELQGIPYAVPLIAIALVVATFVLDRTRYGRSIYAVGGNREAARRAGINVTMIRISGFMIGSSLAAVSGIVAASRLASVAPGAGAGNTLLYAVGAAVIGGTSLFGGRGRARNAVLGGLVIATIRNGLGLLGFEPYLNFIVTGGFLLFAAGVDALSRRRRAAAGR